MNVKLYPKIKLKPLFAAALFSCSAVSALAAEPLKMVAGTMGYPFEDQDEKGQRRGVIIEFGEMLAKDLGAAIEFVPGSRRRVEPGLVSGEFDIACYSSPKWTDNPKALLWSIPTLAQVERVVVLKPAQPPEKAPDDYVGKRVSARLGYSYGAIQPLFDSSKATRVDETKVPFMFKAVSTGFTDMLISSEGEIEGYFQTNPEARQRFAMSSKPFSVVSTQCAVSPKSKWSIEQINKALGAMMKRGDVEKISKRYGLSMK